MKKIILTFFALCFFILLFRIEKVFAQSQFQLTVGGTDYEEAVSIVPAPDGGYVIAGRTNSFGAGGYDIYIVKIDAVGTLQWTKSIGGSGDERTYSSTATADGGFAVCGSTTSYGAGGQDMYILKFDGSGTLQWTRVIGDEKNNVATSMAQTPDGGLIVGGYSVAPGEGYSGYIVKLDASGSLQWSRIERCEYGFLITNVISTGDSGYALLGYGKLDTSSTPIDIFVFKLDSSGYPQWTRSVGGAANDYGFSIVQTTDGGYAGAGYTISFGAGSSDAYVFKLDAGGSVQWTRTIGTDGSEIGKSIIQSSDGGLIIAGFNNPSVLLFKLDAGGRLQWYTTTEEDNWNDAICVISTGDGYITAGRSFTTSPDFGGADMYIVKTDANGKTCSSLRAPKFKSGSGGIFGSPTPDVSTPSPTVSGPTPVEGSGGTLTVFCSQSGGHGGHGHGHSPHINNSNSDRLQEPMKFELEQNYPNPFNPETVIRFQLPVDGAARVDIFDALGREIATLVNEELEAGSHEVKWNAVNYPSGIYFCKLRSGSFTETMKMLLIK